MRNLEVLFWCNPVAVEALLLFHPMPQEAASWISQQVWSFPLDGHVVVRIVVRESDTKGLSRRQGISSIECHAHIVQAGKCGPRNPSSANIVVSHIMGCTPP